MKRKIIDISTEEKKKDVFKKFDGFRNKSQAHEYFGISDNKQGSEYLQEIALSVGFDLNFYKERRIKPIQCCKECGKEIVSKSAKEFCCRSCATKYNNRQRNRKKVIKPNKSVKSKPFQNFNKEEKFCTICGKKLEGKQRKYCSMSCRNKSKYLTEGDEHICQKCGKIFKSRNKERKFCSNECSSQYRMNNLIDKWLKNEYELNPNFSLPKSIRLFLFEKAKYKCEECGFEGYNKTTNNTILQIHHMDGNSGNNDLNNLKVLCPNCHAMTENYMALNKGKSARLERYKRR